MKRDEKGNPSLTGVESTDSPVNVNVNVKYEKEVRFALGVALVKNLDGNIVGMRIKEFDYTEQTILAHKDWQKKVKEAISDVKSRSTDGDGWVKDNRNGLLFEDDTELSLLKRGLGVKM